MKASLNYVPTPTPEPLKDVVPWCLICKTQRQQQISHYNGDMNTKDTEQGRYMYCVEMADVNECGIFIVTIR
jgi:hypothetical protein